MFWLLFWLLSLFVFLVFPAVCVEENRKRWMRRFRQCRWNVDQRTTTPNDPQTGSAEGFHYVVSKAQEDEIREAFLIEKLKNYTQEIAEESIERPRANSKGAMVESVSESGDGKAQEERLTTPEPEDIEQGQPSLEDVQDKSSVVEEEKSGTEEMKEEKESSTESNDIEQGQQPQSDPVNANPESKYPTIDVTTTGETELATSIEAVEDEISEGASSEDMMEVISFSGEDEGRVSVPLAGECRHDVLPENVQGHYRMEPNGCAICLCSFEVADRITWSSNPSCQHVFHDDCIKGWLMASGRKFLKRQRREQRRTGNLSYDSDPVSKITGFPMLCPCCRQHFIMPEEDESVDEKAATPENNDAEMGNEEAMIVAAS